MKTSKKYQQIKEKIDPQKDYTFEEAIDFIQQNKNRKFDESVELHFKLGINLKKTEQTVKGVVVLPYADFIKNKIVAFVEPEKEKEAKEAGADIIGGKDLIEVIKKDGKINFDTVVATPVMMKELVVLAKILGPKGLMPSPKNGTITNNISDAIKQLKTGKTSFKNDDGGNIHQIIGKISSDKNKILKNAKTLLEAVKKGKPSKFKGVYIKKITLCSSMGPSLKIKV
ncbi:MAG: 50S ribosomal protein L1 [Bacteroidetes bacterium]|nr:50S ribosomal protein L1 [Bacteroidota bacterium]